MNTRKTVKDAAGLLLTGTQGGCDSHHRPVQAQVRPDPSTERKWDTRPTASRGAAGDCWLLVNRKTLFSKTVSPDQSTRIHTSRNTGSAQIGLE